MFKASTFPQIFWIIVIVTLIAIIIMSHYESQFVSGHGSLSHCQSLDTGLCGKDQSWMTMCLNTPKTDINWETQIGVLCVCLCDACVCISHHMGWWRTLAGDCRCCR